MKMMKTSSNKILEVHHFEPAWQISTHTVTWDWLEDRKAKRLVGNWKVDELDLAHPANSNIYRCRLATSTSPYCWSLPSSRGLKFWGKPPRYLWIDLWIQRHWGRLRFRDFQISETPEITKLGSKPVLFGIPPGNSGKINVGGDMNNFLVSRSRNGSK